MNTFVKAAEEHSFKYVSLFAGIGGFDTALNELGGECVMASEIDKFAKKAYEVMYGVEPKGDITKIKSEDIPEHDLLTAGFPCQAFSVAGKRAGMAYVCNDCNEEQTLSFNEYADRNFVCAECGGVIEPVDGRGLLFFEVARVARDKQPKMLLLENVKGLVGHDKGRTLDTIVKTLNDIGYTIDFEVLNTKYFGLPQNRERIFIVAFRDDLVNATGWSAESRKGNTVVPKGKRRLHGYENVKSFGFPFPENDTVTSRLIDVLEDEVDEKYYLDDKKTAGLIEELNKGLAVKEATSQGYSVAQEGDSVNVAHPNSKTRRGRVGKQIANTLVASGVEQAVVEKKGVTYNRKDGIKEERDIVHSLFTSDWRGLNRNQNQTAVFESIIDDTQGFDGIRVYKEYSPTLRSERNGLKILESSSMCLGIPQEYKDAIEENKEIRPVLTPERATKRQNGRRFKDAGEEMFTITTQDRHGITESLPMECEAPYMKTIEGGGSTEPKTVEEQGKRHRLRKLTPLECWRLQGFSDEQHNAVEQAGISDSQRYKQAGNAVSTTVIQEVAKRMLDLLQQEKPVITKE